MLRPFGDNYIAIVSTKLKGPKGPIAHDMATPVYTLGSLSFIKLAPRQTFRDRIDLTPALFPGSDEAGAYSIQYTYRMTESHVERARQLQRRWGRGDQTLPQKYRNRYALVRTLSG